MVAPADPREWSVVCLCAEWCGVCRDWRRIFAQAAAARPDVRFGWIDVEDEADAMGDWDVDTFPTLLVADGRRAMFLGPVQPSAAQVLRLLESLQAAAEPLDTDEAHGLWARIEPRLLLIR